MEQNDILLPPDPARVMEGLRDTGYDFNTAVADLIDNSIAAGAGQMDLQLGLDPNGEVFFYLADDGCGMDEEGLKNAMRYGSPARKDRSSLGKFGLGLKTASTAFCRCLSVISIAEDLIPRKMQWDLDHIAQTGEWSLRQPDILEDELDSLQETCGDGTGTLVVWEKVDRLLTGNLTEKTAKTAIKKVEQSLKFHISMVYQRFLDSNDLRASTVEIRLNGAKIDPWDPFCSQEKNTQVLYEDPLEIEIPGQAEIAVLKIRCVLIPRRDEFSTAEAGVAARVSNDMQGFYIYREQRLIHSGNWMGMFSKEPHGTLLRVELSFDHNLDDVFQIDIKKSRILLNESIYAYLRDQVMPAPRRAADERYRKGTQKKVADKGESAHTVSNQTIDRKAKGAENSKVEVVDEQKGEVKVTNSNGTFRHKLTIRHADQPGQYRVIPVDAIDGGVLWAPSIVDERHAVEINRSHPYYTKVYYPVLRENVLVTGMDSLLWALAEAELSSFNEETREQFEDMRFLVSKCLKKLISDLPEPELTEEEN